MAGPTLRGSLWGGAEVWERGGPAEPLGLFGFGEIFKLNFGRGAGSGWADARRDLRENQLTGLSAGQFDKLPALAELYVMRGRLLPRCASRLW